MSQQLSEGSARNLLQTWMFGMNGNNSDSLTLAATIGRKRKGHCFALWLSPKQVIIYKLIYFLNPVFLCKIPEISRCSHQKCYWASVRSVHVHSVLSYVSVLRSSRKDSKWTICLHPAEEHQTFTGQTLTDSSNDISWPSSAVSGWISCFGELENLIVCFIDFISHTL